MSWLRWSPAPRKRDSAGAGHEADTAKAQRDVQCEGGGGGSSESLFLECNYCTSRAMVKAATPRSARSSGSPGATACAGSKSRAAATGRRCRNPMRDAVVASGLPVHCYTIGSDIVARFYQVRAKGDVRRPINPLPHPQSGRVRVWYRACRDRDCFTALAMTGHCEEQSDEAISK
jgi:hypothetical protein